MRHFEDTFKTSDNVLLYWQGWVPAQSRATVCFIHGAFEHSGRFIDACAFLADAGFSVFALDLRGHGRSQGEIGPDTSFLTLLDDVESFIALIKTKAGAPFFLSGQSMGGSLALMASCAVNPAGVILCAPACRLVFPPVSIVAGYALGKVFPDIKFKALEARLLSRDPVVAKAYENDPLVNRQGIPLRPLSEFMHYMRSKQAEFERRDIPFVIFHGTEDKIVDIRGSRELFAHACSKDKTLDELPGVYHDLLNDPERKTVYDRINGWIRARV